MITRHLRAFLEMEALGGILLMLSAVAAMLCANSFLAEDYQVLLQMPVTLAMGSLQLGASVQQCVTDGLMVIFFLLVGLELKRELLEGELSTPSARLLPVVAALGGMALPALIYTLFNWSNAGALRGWAIPSATDIAFALGVLMLLGKRVPLALKVFLTAVAVIDDLGAIVIIAVFYTHDLSWMHLGLAALATALLLAMGQRRVSSIFAYLMVGGFLWWAIHHAGVHATVAGVITGLAMPLRGGDAHAASPLKKLEHFLHPLVTYLVMPLFAFTSAGLPLAGLSLRSVLEPVSLGVLLGLLLGKQMGVFASCWLMIRLRFACLPEGASWSQLYAVCIFTGIGFTMSLFISLLAFGGSQALLDEAKLGIFVGSLLSALCGISLFLCLPRRG